ncbi:MAG: FAD-binding oxidoreductase, partial [Burkholderiales bacterium]
MTEDPTLFDFAVIGAGIAGASVTAELSRSARVLLLEMESQPGYHATGRSAAVFAEAYGPGPIRALTRASAPFFEAPPEGFAEHPLLSDRGIMMIANSEQLAALDAMIEELSSEQPVQRLDPTQARALNPLLRADYVAAAMHDPRGRDIDVHALHHGYLRQARRAGARLVPDSRVTGLERDAGGWRIACRG